MEMIANFENALLTVPSVVTISEQKDEFRPKYRIMGACEST